MVVLILLVINFFLTPGVVRPLTTKQVCSIGWGRDRRHVTNAMKRQVVASYGLTLADVRTTACCEIDHLIPRELGGADDVKNLWPEPWAEAHIKDRRENQLHNEVCAGTIALADAQNEMRRWGR